MKSVVKLLLCTAIALVAIEPTQARADPIANAFDRNSGSNAYHGGLADSNWIESIDVVTPNRGSQFLASGNGVGNRTFTDVGITKQLGGAIEDFVYDVSFFITKYDGFDGLERGDFSTLMIGGPGGTMLWTRTPTPKVDGEWVEWTGSFTPSTADVGNSFLFTAIFDLDPQHSAAFDGLVVAAPVPEPATAALVAAGVCALGAMGRRQRARLAVRT